MSFLTDLVLFALVIIGITAFLGILSASIALPFGGKKKKDSLEKTALTKKGWKRVERKHT